MDKRHPSHPIVAWEEVEAPQEVSPPPEPSEVSLVQPLPIVIAEGMAPPQRILFHPEKICMVWQHSQRAGAGLRNLGNTCFLNSVLQCLTYTPALANHLLSGEHSQSCQQEGFCMMCRMEVHIKQVLFAPASAIEPWAVTNDLTITCWSCQAVSNSYEVFLDASLDIKTASSVTGALEDFVKPKHLDGENCFKCSKCNKMAAASKRFTIHHTPKVLTVCLKRFEGSTGEKISKVVEYPEYLDLHPYMSQTDAELLLYTLYAVLVHSGGSCHAGHYFCYIKGSNGLWYKMDDTSVVLHDINTVLRQQAYLLFYIRYCDSESGQSTVSSLVRSYGSSSLSQWAAGSKQSSEEYLQPSERTDIVLVSIEAMRDSSTFDKKAARDMLDRVMEIPDFWLVDVPKILRCIYKNLESINTASAQQSVESLLLLMANRSPGEVVTVLLRITPQGDRTALALWEVVFSAPKTLDKILMEFLRRLLVTDSLFLEGLISLSERPDMARKMQVLLLFIMRLIWHGNTEFKKKALVFLKNMMGRLKREETSHITKQLAKEFLTLFDHLEQVSSRAEEFLSQSLPYLRDAQASLREAAVRFIALQPLEQDSKPSIRYLAAQTILILSHPRKQPRSRWTL
ncbi:hypothetical protein Q9233_012544 [Columba guinea]|nr:hypothetical protein Q9233_012544 [Columba guinea]